MVGTPGRTRTDTEAILSRLPLPLGYGGAERSSARTERSDARQLYCEQRVWWQTAPDRPSEARPAEQYFTVTTSMPVRATDVAFLVSGPPNFRRREVSIPAPGCRNQLIQNGMPSRRPAGRHPVELNYAFGRDANCWNDALGASTASIEARSRPQKKFTTQPVMTRALRSHVGIASPW